MNAELENLVDIGMRIRELREELDRRQKRDGLAAVKFLPSQQKLIDSYNDPRTSICIFTGPNQTGKSFLLGSMLKASALGYEPWSGKPRHFKTPAKIALLLTDYDNHARKFLENHIYDSFGHDEVHVDRTQTSAPRALTFKNGSIVRIFTSDQDSFRLEGETWTELFIDEPCPRSHYVSLSRGLQKTRGKTIMVMTPLSEPWIFEQIYEKAYNLGGDRRDIFAVTAFPNENLESQGGYLPDADVEAFRSMLSEDEKEARVHGRWTHLIGRVWKSFDENIHVIEDDLCREEDRCYGLTVDPHDRRAFACGFWYLTPSDDLVFHDEWPKTPFEDIHTCSLTYDDYIPILREHESFWKIIDPNFSRKRVGVNGLTVAEEFQIRGIAFDTSVNDDIAAGHKAVEQRLRYDKTRPLDALNAPKLFVKRNCRNIIRAFRNYVWDDWRGVIGEGKAPKEAVKEKYKDFADVVRYTAMARVRHLKARTQTRFPTRYPTGWSEEGRRNRPTSFFRGVYR